MIKIYGIKNCDTMKKAFKFLEAHNIAYDFHDYKKQSPDTDILKQAIAQHGWDTVINRRGTTWRKLPDAVKDSMNDETAIAAACENPSLIKRPLLVHGDAILLGFQEELYKKELSGS